MEKTDKSSLQIYGQAPRIFSSSHTSWELEVAVNAPWSGNFPSLHLDGIAVPHSGMVHNLDVVLDSWLLLEEQVAALVHIGPCGASAAPLPGLSGPPNKHSCPCHLMIQLPQCPLYGAPLEGHPEALNGLECSGTSNDGLTLAC